MNLFKLALSKLIKDVKDNVTVNVTQNSTNDTKSYVFNNGNVDLTIDGEKFENIFNNMSNVSLSINIITLSNISSLGTNSGDINITHLETSDNTNLRVCATSGNIEIGTMNNITDLNINTTSGDVILHDVDTITNSTINTTSGDVDLNVTNVNVLNNKTVSGNIKL